MLYWGGVGLLLYNAAQCFRSSYTEPIFYRLTEFPYHLLKIFLFNCDLGGMGQLWFLFANLCIYIVYSILHELIQTKTILLLSFFLAVLNAIVGTLNVSWGNCFIINVIMSSICYFSLGHFTYMSMQQHFDWFKSKTSLIGAVVFFSLSVIIWKIRPIRIDIRSNDVPGFGIDIFLFYVLSVGCVFCIYRMAKIILNIPFVTLFLQWIGKNTLSVLCLHVYIGYMVRYLLTVAKVGAGSIEGAVILVVTSTIMPILAAKGLMYIVNMCVHTIILLMGKGERHED